jgi:serine/threonine protein kinase
VKRYCSECGTISPKFNVWCSCDVPNPGHMSQIFEYGETLGDLKIIRLVRVLKTGALYEAARTVENKEERVLLKVAHNECADLIKREAVTLAKLKETRQHLMLPVILSAYQYAESKQRPYGKTVFQDETKYYVVYQFAEGEFLRDLLTRNPQPWYQHAAWLTIGMADVIAFLHVKAQMLLLNLSPESVMIRYDRDGIPRPMLVDLSMASAPDAVEHELIKRFVIPAYTAPELIDGGSGPYGAQTDVYGLGLLLYEMLAGHSAYPYKLREPEDVRNAVRTSQPLPLMRSDLAGEVTGIVMQAIDKAPARRQSEIRALAKELRVKFGEVPAERPKRRFPRRLVAAVVAIALFLIAWTVFMAVLQVGA